MVCDLDNVKPRPFFRATSISGVFYFPSVSVSDKNGNVISNEIGASKVRSVLEGWSKLTLGK